MREESSRLLNQVAGCVSSQNGGRGGTTDTRGLHPYNMMLSSSIPDVVITGNSEFSA